jgi:hypothetical protein
MNASHDARLATPRAHPPDFTLDDKPTFYNSCPAARNIYGAVSEVHSPLPPFTSARVIQPETIML